jgi:hypothetical protein
MATKKDPVPQVDRGTVKQGIKERTDCSALVKSKASSCPLWAAHQDLQDAGNALIAAGTDLSDADLAFQGAQKAVETTRDTRETKVITWNTDFELYATLVEKYSKKSEDVSALALSALEKSAYVLVVPISVDLRYDTKTHLIRVHVHLAAGLDACEIEMSPDPVTPTSWKRLVGHGVLRTVKDPGPGTWWFRAAAERADEQSDFTAPVSILVR